MAKKDIKYVYFFGGKKADGDAKMKNLLGGKGANLAEMINMGLPVPAGFTITTEVCTHYYDNGENYPKQLAKQVKDAIKQVEESMGKKFGDAKDPLLLSVRSGARASMPGMMDTVLNLGLNDKHQVAYRMTMMCKSDDVTQSVGFSVMKIFDVKRRKETRAR